MTKQPRRLLKVALDRIQSLCALVTAEADPGTIGDDHAVWADINAIRKALNLKYITPVADPEAADFSNLSNYPNP